MIGSAKSQGPGKYRLVWSKDPALRQLELPPAPADDAPPAERDAYDAAVKKAIADHENAHRVARETDNWSALMVGKDEPTYFVCQWIRELVRRRWKDQVAKEAMGLQEGTAFLFLLALVDVENYGGKKFKKRIISDEWGDMAPPTFLDDLRRAFEKDEDYRALIRELGAQVFEMEETTGPL